MVSKMKVLFVTNGYPTKSSPEFCVFTKEQIESVIKTKNIQGELIFINARDKGIAAYFNSIPAIRKNIKEADLVHAFHGLTFLLVMALAPSKKIVVSFLNKIENEYGEQNLLTRALAGLTRILAKRKNVTKIFKDRIPSDLSVNSFHLPNGVDLSKFYPLDQNEAKKVLGLKKDVRYILFVSSKNQYRSQKRYDRFKEVMALLKQKYDDIEELILVNEPRERIIYYFNAAELHLLTSDYEGSPNSVKESLACNKPVVATNTGNVEQMLENVDFCFVCNSFKANDLAEYVERILSKPKGQKLLINKTIKYKKLDMHSKALELAEIYKKTLTIS